MLLVKLKSCLPVAVSPKLLMLKLSYIVVPAALVDAKALAAACLVSVTGPVPAALLIVFARISDNGQVPPCCDGDRFTTRYRKRSGAGGILCGVYCNVSV